MNGEKMEEKSQMNNGNKNIIKTANIINLINTTKKI